MFIPTHSLDFLDHPFIAIFLLDFSNACSGPVVPMAGYWCVFLFLLTVFADVFHFLAMETLSLFLEASLFFGG